MLVRLEGDTEGRVFEVRDGLKSLTALTWDTMPATYTGEEMWWPRTASEQPVIESRFYATDEIVNGVRLFRKAH